MRVRSRPQWLRSRAQWTALTSTSPLRAPARHWSRKYGSGPGVTRPLLISCVTVTRPGLRQSRQRRADAHANVARAAAVSGRPSLRRSSRSGRHCPPQQPISSSSRPRSCGSSISIRVKITSCPTATQSFPQRARDPRAVVRLLTRRPHQRAPSGLQRPRQRGRRYRAPRNRIFLDIAPSNEPYETVSSAGWFGWTAVHELTHIVDKRSHKPGRYALPAACFMAKVDVDSAHPETLLYNYLTVPRLTGASLVPGGKRGCSWRPG